MKLRVILNLEYKAPVGIFEEEIPASAVREAVFSAIENALENKDLDLSGHDDLRNVELFNYLLDVQEIE